MDNPTSQTADQGASATKKADGLHRFFDEKVRRELIEEDRIAWRNVCGVLFSIVLIGLTLGLIGVLLATTMTG